MRSRISQQRTINRAGRGGIGKPRPFIDGGDIDGIDPDEMPDGKTEDDDGSETRIGM